MNLSTQTRKQKIYDLNMAQLIHSTINRRVNELIALILYSLRYTIISMFTFTFIIEFPGQIIVASH